MAKPTGRSFFFSQRSDVTRVYACPERACGISVAGPGSEPESAFLKPEIGRIGRACACARDLSALELERQVSLVRGGSGHSFRLLLLSEAAGSSSSFLFSLSLSLLLRFFRAGRKKTFFPWHAFTHARHLCTQHAPLSYAVCICTRLFTNLNANSVDRGVELPPFLSSRLQASSMDPRWIFSRKRRFLLEQKFSFITVGLILLLSFFCNWNCSY